MSATPTNKYATLIHGDAKAMNMMLGKDCETDSVLIDFCQTGVGFGMSDIAFLIIHSVAPDFCQTGVGFGMD